MTETRLEDLSLKTSGSPADSLVKSSRERHDWPGAPSEPTGELLSIAEIERRFGVTRYQIFKWAKERKLHVVPIGKRFKYPDWEVADILRATYGHLRAVA